MLILMTGCGPGSDAPQVSDARLGRPAGSNGALYMSVQGHSQPDRLISARTSASRSIELHESVIAADGTATMRRVASFDLPARGSLSLEPGGLHLMLIDIDRLELGEEVAVTLVWERAGEHTITAIVVDPSDTIIDENDPDHG